MFVEIMAKVTPNFSFARVWPPFSVKVKTTHCQGLCTVQDMGRPSCRAWGVPSGGAVDLISHQVANFLVQNEPTAATIEVAGGHLSAEVQEGGWTALFGLGSELFLNGIKVGMGRKVFAPTGAKLDIRPDGSGSFAYWAVRGGWDFPTVLGSRGTCLSGQFGGMKGRALSRGDLLSAIGMDATALPSNIWVSPWVADWHALFPKNKPIRALTGPEWDENFPFFALPFTIGALRDRMGARLEAVGKWPGRLLDAKMISVPVVPGTVQLPPSGQPIVLLADAQTTGGYPRIAQIIAADLPRLVQAPRGQALRFQQVTMQEAEQQQAEQDKALGKLKAALNML
jgi:biotin-dependent carboxylase-like uncharacterized protein